MGKDSAPDALMDLRRNATRKGEADGRNRKNARSERAVEVCRASHDRDTKVELSYPVKPIDQKPSPNLTATILIFHRIVGAILQVRKQLFLD